jgi:hypothetical protein
VTVDDAAAKEQQLLDQAKDEGVSATEQQLLDEAKEPNRPNVKYPWTQEGDNSS